MGSYGAAQIKQDDPGAVTYTINELRKLLKLNSTPEDIKRIHGAKDVFDVSKVIEGELKEDSDEH